MGNRARRLHVEIITTNATDTRNGPHTINEMKNICCRLEYQFRMKRQTIGVQSATDTDTHEAGKQCVLYRLIETKTNIKRFCARRSRAPLRRATHTAHHIFNCAFSKQAGVHNLTVFCGY